MAGDPKEVGEGLEVAVGADLEEEEGREVPLLAGEVLDHVEKADEYRDVGQAVWGRPSRVWAGRSGAFGDVEGIPLLALTILRETFLEPLDPAGVEEKEI